MKNFHKLSIILTVSLVSIVGFSLTASAQSTVVPEWVKNNAKWWAEGSISEADYLTSLEYLISNGIIDVQVPFVQVTAAQNILSEEERGQFFSVTFYEGLIPEPVTVDTFIKFEATSSSSSLEAFYQTPIYVFEDKPSFVLEGLPSKDKQPVYEGIHRWMTQKTTLSPFDVDVAVISGDGTTLLTWTFTDCKPTAFGTYLQDLVFYYQFANQERAEIRDRATFECLGADLKVPEN